jgi:hypothetical protein
MRDSRLDWVGSLGQRDPVKLKPAAGMVRLG